MFDMCTKGEEMTLDELRGMLKQLGEEEKNERTLFMIHEKCKKREDFIKFWSETLTDIVAPKAAPPIPKSNNAAPSKSSSSTSSSSSSSPNTHWPLSEANMKSLEPTRFQIGSPVELERQVAQHANLRS